jgi:hypothetical protein
VAKGNSPIGVGQGDADGVTGEREGEVMSGDRDGEGVLAVEFPHAVSITSRTTTHLI